MKIYIAGPRHFGYTTPLINALQRAGHDVCFCIHEGQKYSYLRKKIAQLGIGPSWRELKKRYSVLMEQKLKTEVADFKPDRTILVNTDWITASTLLDIRRNSHYLIWAGLDGIDTFGDCASNIELQLAKADKIICLDKSEADKIKKRCGKDSVIHPYGYDPEVFFDDHSVVKDVDICFVGSKTANRLPLLRAVARYARKHNLKFEVYGPHFWQKRNIWKKYILALRYNPLPEYVKNHCLNHKDAAALYRRSKLCLNIHVNVHDILNNRTFEAMACGSLVLSDYKYQFEELFELGKDMDCYADENELLQKIELYLNNDQLRKKVTETGMIANKKFVLDNFARLFTI